jgi:hypothetical protein
LMVILEMILHDATRQPSNTHSAQTQRDARSPNICVPPRADAIAAWSTDQPVRGGPQRRRAKRCGQFADVGFFHPACAVGAAGIGAGVFGAALAYLAMGPTAICQACPVTRVIVSFSACPGPSRRVDDLVAGPGRQHVQAGDRGGGRRCPPTPPAVHRPVTRVPPAGPRKRSRSAPAAGPKAVLSSPPDPRSRRCRSAMPAPRSPSAATSTSSPESG